MPYVYNPITGKNDLWQPEPVKEQFGQIGQNIRNFSTGPMGDAPRQTKTIKEQFGQIGQNIRNFSTGGAPSSSASVAMLGTGATPPSATQLAGYSRATPNYLSGLSQTEMPPEGVDAGAPTAQPSTDWTQLFAQFRQSGLDAAEATRLAQQTAAQNTYEAQMRSAQTAARENQMAVRQAREQIAEQSFEQQRALTQGAQSRGLGGSGIEQLARTQQRMGTGRNINQLAQQEMLGNEKLMNYVSEVETKKGEKLAEADAQYYNNLFKLAGNDLENMKFLDSVAYRDKVFDWQKENAKEITDNNNLNTKLDLVGILENPNLSDAGKKSTIAMMLEGNKITQQEANDFADQYLGAAAGDKIIKGKFDWSTAIAVGALVAVGIAAVVAFPPLIAATPFLGAATVAGGTALGATKLAAAGALVKIGAGAATAGLAGGTAAGVTAGGISGLARVLGGKVSYRLSDGTEWNGTRADAIDKNNPESLVVREFGNRQAFKDMQFALEGTEVKIVYKGVSYDRFNDAQAVWLRTQGR
jgi:hypothetical protein